jgi:hypothetical protein
VLQPLLLLLPVVCAAAALPAAALSHLHGTGTLYDSQKLQENEWWKAAVEQSTYATP